MWNEPTLEELAALPRLYETENDSLREKVIRMHFFLGGCDWYVAEYSPEERVLFGYCILNNDMQMAEWGYTGYDELRSLKVGPIEVDRDLHWRVRRAIEVDRISEGNDW